MANNYTPEEIQEVFDEYHRNLSNGIPITRDLAERMRDATTGVKNYTYQLNQSFKSLGSSIKTLGSDIAKGAEGASVFNDSLDKGSDVISNFASKFGLAGAVLGGVAKAGAAYVGAVNKQSDALYKSFQDLSKTGSIGAGGMNEVFTSMQKFGYAVDELGQMQSLLAQNSTSLAKFGGTAFEGARALSNVSQVLQRGQLGERFRNMGMSVDDINQNAAGYVKTQIALGRNRTDVEKNLTAETAKYIEQVVAVQKLTGQTREQLEEKEAQANREEAFAYQQYELKKRAAAGDRQAEKEYERNRQLSQILEGKTREQFIAGIGGDVAAMGDLMRTAPDTVQKMLSGADTPEILESLSREGKRAVDNLGPMARFHGFNNVLLPMHELLELMSQYGGKNMSEVMDSIDKNKETVDGSTKEQTKMRIAQMNSRQSMENFVNAGVDPVTKAMKILAYTVEWLTDLLPGSSSAKAKYEKEQDAANKKQWESQSKTIDGLGKVAAHFESGANAGKVSSGVGDHGGKSYGAFQLSSKTGDVQKFLDESGYADHFKGLKVGSEDFDNKWRQLGTDKKFAEAQQAHAMKTHYNPQVDRLKRLGLDLSSKGAGVQEAIMSTANQYGANSDVIEKALAGKDINRMSESDIINAIQDYKASTVQSRFRSSSQRTQAAVADRIRQEREMLQAISSAPTTAAAPATAGVSGAFGFNGTLSGPMSGYRPNLLMHGTEQISIKPSSNISESDSNSYSGTSPEMMDKLDDLIQLAKAQLSVNERILKYQQ
jgi:hypothetical protein